jgi:hypothetical protein
MTEPFRGSSSDVTQGRLRGPGYRRLTRDVYVLQDRATDLRARCEAGILLFPKAVVCLSTATSLLRLPVDDDGVVHVDRGKDAPRTERHGFKTHRLGIPESRIHELDGLRVADGPRCFADLSARLTLEELVALGDVVARRWTNEDIAAAVADHGRRPGAVLLRQAVPLLDKRSGSPAETRARLRLHAAGFVSLVHGVVIRGDDGGWLAEPDLGDEVAKVAVQHEGEVHFLKGAKQRRHDVDRDELSRRQGWEVVISTATDDARPHRLVERVAEAYLRSAERWGRHVLPAHLR